jgi:hypothetical protein
MSKFVSNPFQILGVNDSAEGSVPVASASPSEDAAPPVEPAPRIHVPIPATVVIHDPANPELDGKAAPVVEDKEHGGLVVPKAEE